MNKLPRFSSRGEILTPSHEFLSEFLGNWELNGSWSGDSHAFHECSELHCWQCTNDAFAVDGGASGDGARCTGLTSCSNFGAGNCGNHQGCSLHGHAVYSSGMFDHYDNECQGSTPSCSNVCCATAGCATSLP